MRHPSEPVTIIVGASRPLGGAIAQRLAAAGHRLVLIGERSADVRGLGTRLDLGDAPWRTYGGDPTNAKKVRRFIDEALLHFGRVDNLVYALGAEPSGGLIETVEDDVEAHWLLHVRGPFHWLQTLLPHMLHEGGGRLVFLVGSDATEAIAGNVAASTAQGALASMLRSIGHEHASAGIQPVTAIVPGTIEQPGIEPNQIADDVEAILDASADDMRHVAYIGKMDAPSRKRTGRPT